MGRWVNRDPIEERGGLNVAVFVENNPPSRVDALGLVSGCVPTGGVGVDPGKCCCGTKTYNSFGKCCCSETKNLFAKQFDVQWKGRCGIFDGGYWIGGAYLACALDSGTTPDCKRWHIGVHAFFVGFALPGAGGTTFNATFTGASVPEDFVGVSWLWNLGGAVIGGGSLGKINLGAATSTGYWTWLGGIDVGGSGLLGWATLLLKEERPCRNWE